jgi:hypothetical protein
VKGENAAQRREAAKRYLDWQEFIVDEWHPHVPDNERVKLSTAKLVALAKAMKTDYGRTIFRSDQYVADASGLDRMTVQRHMKFLVAAGVFRPTGRRHGRAQEMIIAMPEPMLPVAAIETEPNDACATADSDACASVDSESLGSTNLSDSLRESLPEPSELQASEDESWKSSTFDYDDDDDDPFASSRRLDEKFRAAREKKAKVSARNTDY